IFADPRSDKLGWRILAPEELAARAATVIGAELVESADYEAHRIAAGVPSGGTDFTFGDAFPHEANMDRLHGVDFDKGCYVGQEVVSRMEHRGTARSRIVRVLLDDGVPEAGTAVVAADKPVGTMGSSAAGHGLALLRLDRAADAIEAGIALTAGGIPIRVADPDDLKLPEKKTVA
ncbi:MAG TPA: folate-binding protein, partial [Nitrobacter sp.]|nr:folate-binding protein [Nitrobacter sp.]